MLDYITPHPSLHTNPTYHHITTTTPLQCILYFVMGLTFYTQHPETQWSFIEALYFCMVTLTTVGYGDNPTIGDSNAKMLFTSFFVLYAVGAIATCVSSLIDWYIAKQELILQELQDEMLDAMLDDDEEKEFKVMEEKKRAGETTAAHTTVHHEPALSRENIDGRPRYTPSASSLSLSRWSR